MEQLEKIKEFLKSKGMLEEAEEKGVLKELGKAKSWNELSPEVEGFITEVLGGKRLETYLHYVETAWTPIMAFYKAIKGVKIPKSRNQRLRG